jgi:heterodisulfide reductase subunit A
MKRVLAQMGIEPGRLKLLWASAAEGAIFASEISKFVAEVKALGPLNWNPTEPEVEEELVDEVPA